MKSRVSSPPHWNGGTIWIYLRIADIVFQIMFKKIASIKHGNETYYDIIKRIICMFEEALGIL